MKFLNPEGIDSYDIEAMSEMLRERYNVTSSVEKARSPVSDQLVRELEEFYRTYDTRVFKLVGRKLW